MTTAASTSTTLIDVPSDIGRNDPCPCGSGKKYKKCHMRINQALNKAEKKTRSIEQLISSNTNPYQAYKILADINANNLIALFYDAGHIQGPWRKQHAKKDDFLLAASEGKFTLPAGSSFEFLRMRVDEPDVHILLASNADDPRYDQVTYQVITLRRNEFDVDGKPRQVPNAGWRLWDFQTKTVAKSTLSEEEGANIHLDNFGIGWHPRDVRDYPTHVRQEEEEA